MPYGDDNEAKAGKAHDLRIAPGILMPEPFSSTWENRSQIFLDPFSQAGSAPFATPLS